MFEAVVILRSAEKSYRLCLYSIGAPALAQQPIQMPFAERLREEVY